MTLTTYPLDDCDYSADDAALFHCTRTSGIFASDDFSFSVSGSDNTVRVGPGIAWMRINKFKGLVAALKNEVSVDLGLPDSVYSRIDRVVLQYNANTRDTTVVVKSGVPRSNPLPPARSTEESLYELHLLEVLREPAAASVKPGNVTDLRFDSSCCGLMADSVTNIDTAAIQAQVYGFIRETRQNADTILHLIMVELEQLESGTAVELRKMLFQDVFVPASAFLSNGTYQDFQYRASVDLELVRATMIPEVILGVEDAVSGDFAPVAETYDGGVYIYASSPPQNDITIPTIICWRGA